MTIENLMERRNKEPQTRTPVLSAGELHNVAIPPREWLIPGILLRRSVTMLSGDGGVGKSLSCLQMMVACALGVPWLGVQIPCPITSFAFMCEDEKDEIHRRLADCARHYGASLDEIGDRVRFVSRIGENNELVTFRGGGEKRTAVYESIQREIDRWGRQLIIIDTVADTFGGNENWRSQTRSFINAIRQLGFINNGGVILTAHPSRAGLADGTGISGSTGWNNSVRARVYLTYPANIEKDEDGETYPTNERILKTMKSNYSQAGEKWRLQWRDGVFIRTDLKPKTMVEQYESDKNVLEAAIFLVQRGQLLSATATGRSNLMTLAKSHPSCRMMSPKAIGASQERLLEKGDLVLIDIGAKRYVRPKDMRIPGEREKPKDLFGAHGRAPDGESQANKVGQ